MSQKNTDKIVVHAANKREIRKMLRQWLKNTGGVSVWLDSKNKISLGPKDCCGIGVLVEVITDFKRFDVIENEVLPLTSKNG